MLSEALIRLKALIFKEAVFHGNGVNKAMSLTIVNGVISVAPSPIIDVYNIIIGLY